MFNQLLNIVSSAHWQENSHPNNCTKKILSWLLDEASLTKKLEQQCKIFTVEVKLQVNTDANESKLSQLFPAPEPILVREVLLRCDGVANIFAQTEIPHRTLTNEQKNLAQIGSESLGKFLFQNVTLQRGSIEIAEFPIGSPLHDLCNSLQQSCEHSLWARRSLFYIENKPLLVSEVFLPASGIYQ